MSVATFVNTTAYSVTYLTDNLLRSLKLIIILSGLDPGKIVADWAVLERGIKTWLYSRHLEGVSLEISLRLAGRKILMGRWDFDIYYSGVGSDGSLSIDPEAIKYAIKKCGIDPAECDYTIVASTSPGHPPVLGWGSTTFLSTEGFDRHSIGTTIDGGQISSQAAYWRKL